MSKLVECDWASNSILFLFEKGKFGELVHENGDVSVQLTYMETKELLKAIQSELDEFDRIETSYINFAEKEWKEKNNGNTN